MDIEPGMTNHIRKKGETLVKRYKQETAIRGLGKTALQRMLTEFYFSELFSNEISIKPIRMDLNMGEVTFGLYPGIPLSSLLKNDSSIPEEILDNIGRIIQSIHKNKLKTDKQSLKSYSDTLKDFIDRSSEILGEYKINKSLLTKYNNDMCSIFSECFDQQPEVVTHGDFWLSNLLYSKKDKEIKLIDWEFADAGSTYLDLGTYYCYSLGFTNGADLFLKNAERLKSHSIQLIRYFAIYRILRILSFVTLEDVRKTSISDEYGLAYLINILRILLEDSSGFQMDSGREIKESIDSRTKVAVLVISPGKKVLLLKRMPDDKFPNIWEPPGGRKEKGETLLDAVEREIHEETGLSLTTGFKYLGETNFPIKGEDKTVNAVFFTIQTDEQSIELREHEEYGWFSIEEAVKLVAFDFVRDLLWKAKNG